MTRKIFTIYKATNKFNGKCYIGFDSSWPHRKYAHFSCAFNTNSNLYFNLFYRAIRKYGKDAFEWEILYQSYDGAHCLNKMEAVFINENRSFGKSGYNMTIGGDGTLGRKHSEETKRKLSKIRKENPIIFTKEHRKKISEANSGEENGFFNKSHTKESKERNRISHLGRKHSTETKTKMKGRTTWNKGQKIYITKGAKLTTEDVIYIRNTYNGETKIFAEQYNVSQNMIRNIVLRKSWNHV